MASPPPREPDPQPAAPQPTAPATHPKDRRAALIGLVVGALIATGSSWWTAQLTSDRSDSQSLNEYRRDARREAYAETLTRFDAMIAMQDDAEHEIAYLRHGTERPLSGEEYDTRSIEWFRRHKEVYESVASACRTNEIIASQRVVDTCNAILVSNRNYLTEFDERLKALVDPASPSQFKEVIIGFDDFHPPNIPNELKNLTNEDLRDKFVDAARSDLGATD